MGGGPAWRFRVLRTHNYKCRYNPPYKLKYPSRVLIHEPPRGGRRVEMVQRGLHSGLWGGSEASEEVLGCWVSGSCGHLLGREGV